MNINPARLTLWPGNASTKRPASALEQDVVPSTKRILQAPDFHHAYQAFTDVLPNKKNPKIPPKPLGILQEQSPWIVCKKYMKIDLKLGIDTFLVSYNERMAILGIIGEFRREKLNKSIEIILSSQHKNLVQVQKLFFSEQNLYILSEYMDISLIRLIACKRLAEIEIASIIKEVIHVSKS